MSLERSDVIGRLGSQRTVWLVTIGSDGAPHVAPVWCAVARDTLCVFSYSPSAKARNLAADARATMHTEDGEDVLIVHGRLTDIGTPAGAEDVVAAFTRKYDDPDDIAFLPGVDPAVDVLFALEPQRALAWRLADFDGSQERWTA
jgi:hypothetical protein